ncbi:MAG: hypothetical protein Q7J79_12010 [Gemmatimonadales bacterium]|nr:hypothetical protein [Gemmatimonadales bacterium]
MTGPFVLAAVLAAAQADSLAPRLIDNFERLAGWTAHPADGVTLTLRSDARPVPLDSAGTVTIRRLPAEVRFVY